MGELFRWERPKEELPFTGERFTSATSGQIEIEHLHRYFLARELSRGKAVLDIASGEGYGAALLAQVATSVIGVELDAVTVRHASRAYGSPRLRFICGDVRAIPLASGTIDVAVSFETIEHIYDHEVFLKELRRVLKPAGTLIISTPDRDTYSPPDSLANPFHVRELSIAEFADLLKAHFRFVSCLLQRPMLGSVLLPAPGAVTASDALTFESRGPDSFEASEGLPRAAYAVAMASAEPVRMPPASFYIETSEFGSRLGEAETARSENQRLDRLFQEARSESERLEKMFQEARSENARLERLFQEARSENERLEKLFQEARSENERLEKLFQDARSENARLEPLFQQARSENERLEKLFQDAQSENARLEPLFQRVRSENERLEKLFQEAGSENERLERLLQAARAENERLEKLFQDARSENARLEPLYREARSENERLERLLADMRAERERSQASIGQMAVDLAAERQRLADVSMRLQTIERSTSYRILGPLRAVSRFLRGA